MKLAQICWLSCAVCILLTAPCSAQSTLRSAPVTAGWLQSQGISHKGSLIDARRVFARHGEHVLVLYQVQGPSPSHPASGRIERRALTASFNAKTASGWATEWQVKDGVDCPGLDSAAAFFTKNVTITDLNKDGRVEITLPYYLFCGGGIEPRTVKVILREGATKLAVRGKSLIAFPNQQPFGGEHRYDQALRGDGMTTYRSHLEQIWKAVSVEKRQ